MSGVRYDDFARRKPVCCSGAGGCGDDRGRRLLRFRRPVRRPRRGGYLLAGGLLLAAWWALYLSLPPFSKWFTYSLLSLAPDTRLGTAVEFFVYDAPKVLLLLTLVVFGVGIVRSFFTPERTRKILAGKREAVGNVMAALLGIVTPFCSCSAVPLFIGFVTSGVPLGVTFSFLISAPMVNEIALVLLYGLFGWKVAALYLGTGLVIAMVSGWVIGRLGMERYVEEWVYAIRRWGRRAGEERCRGGTGSGTASTPSGTSSERCGPTCWPGSPWGRRSTGTCRRTSWPGSWERRPGGRSRWRSLIGIPMYSNAAGIIPVVQALLGKGAALGTVLAFMMSVIALSLPEMIILRKVLKVRLIATFSAWWGSGSSSSATCSTWSYKGTLPPILLRRIFLLSLRI